MSEYTIPYNLTYVFPKETMENMADEIRELSGSTNLLTTDDFINYIKNANDLITEQSNLITQILAILAEKGAI